MSDKLAGQGPGPLRYVWLVYLVALVFQPIFDPDSGAGDWLAAVVLAAAFLPIYFATFRARSDRQVLTLIAAMVALAVAGSLVNSGAAVFVVYASAAAARLEPVRRAVLVIAGLVGAVGLMFVISPVPFPYRLATFAPALIVTIVVGAASIVDAERGRAHRRLLLADEEIERLAALAERARIARDLHDLLGHTLSVIVVKAELAGKLLALDAERAAPEVADIERIGREALSRGAYRRHRVPDQWAGGGTRRRSTCSWRCPGGRGDRGRRASPARRARVGTGAGRPRIGDEHRATRTRPARGDHCRRRRR